MVLDAASQFSGGEIRRGRSTDSGSAPRHDRISGRASCAGDAALRRAARHGAAIAGGCAGCRPRGGHARYVSDNADPRRLAEIGRRSPPTGAPARPRSTCLSEPGTGRAMRYEEDARAEELGQLKFALATFALQLDVFDMRAHEVLLTVGRSDNP